MGLNIAIIGLGRVGGEFLKEILPYQERGVIVRYAAELTETPAKELARASGVEVISLDEVIARGKDVDIIFDLSGSRSVRGRLRDGLADFKNTHTVIAPETVGRLVWTLITDRALPDVHDKTGY